MDEIIPGNKIVIVRPISETEREITTIVYDGYYSEGAECETTVETLLS